MTRLIPTIAIKTITKNETAIIITTSEIIATSTK